MSNTELYSPNLLSKGVVKQGHVYIQNAGYRPVTYTEYDDLAVFEGDIVLGDAATMNKISAAVETAKKAEHDFIPEICAISTIGKLWPNAIIPYEISDEMSNNKAIKDAIKYYQTHTALRLVKRSAADADYVRFVLSDGCSSHVGMKGGMQLIRIADWASKGNVIHEIAHTAGLWHEQSRADMDHYVAIHPENLENPSDAHNFNQYINEGWDLGTYDYCSIMHYSETAFAKPDKRTIIPIDTKAKIGQRDEMTLRDKLGLQVMYLFENLDPIVELQVIKGDSPDLPVPAGYIKLNQDLNEGSGGKYIYLCYKKGTRQQMANAITGITVITGNGATIQAPAGYQKIDVDLNTNSGGKYIYICYQRGGEVPLTNVTVVSGGSTDAINNVGYGFSVIPQDLNQGCGGKYVYLCYQADPLVPIEDVTIISGDNDKIEPPAGYERVNVNLNKGAKGKYIYLCLKREKSTRPISDLTVISGDSASIKPPADFEKICKNLNEEDGGKYIYVCKKRGSASIKNIGIIYGNFSDIQPPEGWVKLPQGTNQGAGGKYIYICYEK